MANSLTIARNAYPPSAVRAALGGVGTFNNTYSFAVLGWDTDDESDIQNSTLVGYGAAIAYQAYDNLALTNDEAVVSWAHPQRRPKSHYSVYYQQSADMAITAALAYKCLPATGLVRGNIPPSTNSVTIAGPTSVTETRMIPILTKNVAANTITVPGDITISLLNGAQIYLYASGATDTGATTVKATGSNVTVSYGEYGKVTNIITAADLVDATLGYLQYTVGPICQAYVDQSINTMTISGEQVSDFTAQLFGKHGSDIAGYGYSRSLITPFGYGRQCDALNIGLLHGGITAAQLWELNEWQTKQLQVYITNTVDTANATYPSYYYGHISSITDLETYKHYNDSIDITFAVQYEISKQQYYANDDIPIATATAGAAGAGTITVSGYWVDRFFVGRIVQIQSSTGNDGYYSVSAVSYASGVTTITLAQALPDGTDNGMVQAIDW